MLRLGAIHRPAPFTVQPLRARVRLALRTPPASVDWFKRCPADGDALGNDMLGNCVPVAAPWICASCCQLGLPSRAHLVSARMRSG